MALSVAASGLSARLLCGCGAALPARSQADCQAQTVNVNCRQLMNGSAKLSSKLGAGARHNLHSRRTGRHGQAFRINAMDASVGGDAFPEGPAQIFPRIGVKDPYKRLGISRDASTEELTDAKSYLVTQYGGDERSREAIEGAYDKIIAEKFTLRRRSKINLKADLKKKLTEGPAWVRAITGMVEVPKSNVIVQRAALFLIIAVWSVLNASESGPAFQVFAALAGSIYLINDRLKSLGRAFMLGFGGLVVGWVVGSLVVPAVSDILPAMWSGELVTSLVAYVFLWIATTFLK
eukprot:jgi/Mesen1/4316/ME000022S03603